MQRIILLLIITICLVPATRAQHDYSVASDLSYVRSLNKGQRFGVLGVTLQFQYHADSLNSFYAWTLFTTFGKPEQPLSATGKTPAVVPAVINFTNESAIRIKHYSIGWKRYLRKGAYAGDDLNWSIYGLAGFGLMAGQVTNTWSSQIDATQYNLPSAPVAGFGRFKRLSFDMGAGWEKTLSDRVFVYTEARALIPTTYYPSAYLNVSSKAPLLASVNAGLRILFD